jgi:glycosyltransferase involved in cell wall biosynthesis
MTTVSVIIPCYNQGHFLEEAVQSVLHQTMRDFEIIVVNDGSTDESTRQILATFNRDKTRILHTENQGLASARNNGIQEARGKYILPLDADDLIEPRYLEKAVEVLEQNEDVGIVYCRARLFGVVETEWLLPPYTLAEMLKDNVIFCSALFRKDDWYAVGGYDAGMIYGWEDYDFWLSLIERGRRVLQLPDILFAYRVASDSMVRSKEKWQKICMFKRVYERHPKLYQENIAVWIEAVLDAREHYYTSRLYVDCGEGISDASSVSRKIEGKTSEIHFNIESFNNIHALRFDPVDVAAVVEIFKFRIEYVDGKTLEFRDCTDNALFVNGGDRFFGTDDPQCFLPLAPENLSGIRTVIVILSFKALEQNALKQVVDFQIQKIQSLSETIDRLEKSGPASVFISCLKSHLF